MSPNATQTPGNSPEQPNDLETFESRINALRQQIVDLQRDVAYLEEHVRHLKRQQALQIPAAHSVLANLQVDHQLKEFEDRSSQRLSQRGELILLGLLVLFAFVIRVYQLGSFPDTVLADEADNVQDSLRILYGYAPVNGFFGLDWTNQPAFSAYKEAAFIAIFGFNIFAMRLSSAVISTLALIPFYLLLRRQFSIIASLSATVLLATDVWYLNFSRSGWNCIDICFYMLMAMLFLMWGCDAMTSANNPRWKKWAHFAAAGFFCALGLYGYPAGRAITLAVAAFFPIAWLFNRRHFRTLLLGYLLLFGVEAATFAPEAIYVARNWERFNGRSNVVLILNSPDYKANPKATLLQQVQRNIRGPWDGRVNNTPQYSPVGEPQLDRFTGILVLIGMAFTLILGRYRSRSETWLWWLMLLAGWALTQLLTVSTPNGARGIGYMPTLVYFVGVSLDSLLQVINHFFLKRIQLVGWTYATKYLTIAIFTGIVLLGGYSNVAHYVEWQSKPHTREERYLYITEREFSDWSAVIVDLAKGQGNTMNVGQWREVHPVEDRANPYGVSP